MTQFSDKLKLERESKGWSKTKLAKYIGVGLSTYANWEYGVSEPDIKKKGKGCTNSFWCSPLNLCVFI